MTTSSIAALRARAAAHEEEIVSVTWLTPQDLAARWKLSLSTIYAIPIGELRYKAFGTGASHRRRRYRLEWVEAYEAATGVRSDVADASDV